MEVVNRVVRYVRVKISVLVSSIGCCFIWLESGFSSYCSVMLLVIYRFIEVGVSVILVLKFCIMCRIFGWIRLVVR